MEILGSIVGQPVRLFTVFSKEAKHEAMTRLLPSQIRNLVPSERELIMLKEEKERSAFFIRREDLISELAQRSLSGVTYPLSLYDHLLLCVRRKWHSTRDLDLPEHE